MTSNGPVSCRRSLYSPGAGDRRVLDVVAAQHVHAAKPFPRKALQATTQLAGLAVDHVFAEVAVGPGRVALGGHPFRDVQHDRDGQHVVLAGQRHE